MNDEITIIGDELRIGNKIWYGMSKEILDYITNLQQENEYLKKNNPEQNIEHFRIIKENKRKINNLREENKTLHENNQAMQEEMARVWGENERLKDIVIEKDSQIKEMIIQKTDYTAINILEMKLEDYKSRCEKGIEYNNQIIKDIKDFYRPTTDIIYSGDSLIEIATNNINILQGENNGN